MLYFFGPLTQFDVLLREPACYFDLFFYLSGRNELNMSLTLLFFFPLVWQGYEYYTSTLRNSAVVYFDDEPIITDLSNEINYTYTDFISLLFALIFSCNLSGMIPYTQTVTSQIIFTFLISCLVMYMLWFQSLYLNKILMLNHFLPNGAPLIITPFIILIEVVSNLSRIVSIAVRLFANMTSGHALLKILASFSLAAMAIGFGWAGLMFLPTVVVFIITVLEVLIAFLQTYVFVTLLLIYVSEQSSF